MVNKQRLKSFDYGSKRSGLGVVLLSILITLLFLVSNSGIVVSAHWCGGKLASVDLFANGEHKCKCGKKAMKPNCCTDKTVQLKANNDLSKTTHFSFKISTLKFLFAFLTPVDLLPSVQFQYAASDFYHPPPFKPKTPIYLLDNVFLI